MPPGERAQSPPQPAARPRWSVVLRAVREARGVTLEGWAARVGVSRATAQRWEAGARVPDTAAEAAILAYCRETALFRAYERGPLAGLVLTAELLQELLAEARWRGGGGPDASAPPLVSPTSEDAGDVVAEPETPPVEQQIRFCTAPDGARLAYATAGAGPPLVKAANWLSHLEFDRHSPVWRHWLAELSGHHTLIRYDERGCGLSDWDADEFSLEAWVRDLETVVDALAIERFPLLGVSKGGAVAVAYATRHPERVSHLILYGAFARGRLERPNSLHEIELAKARQNLIEFGWGQENPAFRQFFTSLFIPDGTPEQMGWFNDLQRISTSPAIATRIQAASNNLNVTGLARQIAVPTLVLHSRADAVVPFEEGRHLATLIPGARFVPLEGKNHILLATEPAWPRFLSEVQRFLESS
jgi:pimeloyl-ACP methyl ester carboxylesterase/transcriptional regulator with XRE-family HTH domain